ncbi:MAG: carboxylesterase family protein, partial [Fibrobacter sp.]|nr:carboxylesterase family protein [Fibrobacter sp.]
SGIIFMKYEHHFLESSFKMNKNALAAILLFIGTISTGADTRYVDQVFPEIEVKTITYRTAQDYSGKDIELKMDIYEPKNDAQKNRPVVVVLFGGAFMTGNKDDTTFSVPVSEYFAKKGYVAAAINYRVGFNFNITNLDPTGITKAAYRGIQDTKAAVRFLKANAKNYNVSTEEIFLCGYSAGAIIALNQALLTEEMFLEIADTAGLGPLETGDNLSFSSSFKASAGFAGAVIDTGMITTQTATPMICIHGTNDQTVPYGAGNPFSMPALPQVFGSSVIYNVSKRLDINCKLVTYEGKDHQFVSDKKLLASSVDSVSQFFASLITSGVKYQNFAKRNTHQIGAKNALNTSYVYDLSGRKAAGLQRSAASVYIYQKKQFNNKRDFKKILIAK